MLGGLTGWWVTMVQFVDLEQAHLPITQSFRMKILLGHVGLNE